MRCGWAVHGKEDPDILSDYDQNWDGRNLGSPNLGSLDLMIIFAHGANFADHLGPAVVLIDHGLDFFLGLLDA